MSPSLSELQTLAIRSNNWVAFSVLEAPESDGVNRGRHRVGMYRSLPLVAKVRPGYTIPGAYSDCHYVRHLGSVTDIYGAAQPQMKLHLISRTPTSTQTQVEIGPWPDGQPSIWFQINRTYTTDPDGWGWTNCDIYYYGKPVNDTRGYPIDLYWSRTKILDDHRRGAGWIWSAAWPHQGGWSRSNKYFVRTEDLVALKLLAGTGTVTGLQTWCSNLWGDTDADIHSPLFGRGLSKADNYMFQAGYPMYQDCGVSHSGCPSGWPADMKREAPYPNGYGFSHRSKVCIWPYAYTWVLAQDPLGLLAQAIHVLLKTNNPWAQYASPWPPGVPGGPPMTVTPAYMAEWVWNKFYRPGVGVTMYQVPVIGGDNRASSLRTNQMLVLATLLGYRYLAGGWAARADEIADILRQVSVGGPTQPVQGIRTDEFGDIIRPDYFGAQLYVWDTVTRASAASPNNSGLGLKDFGWFRQALNHFFNLPEDDNDFILSTVETTATYAQALRTYAYYKHGWLLGTRATIPG